MSTRPPHAAAAEGAAAEAGATGATGGAAAGAAGAAAADASAWSSSSRLPSPTLSPSLTFISLTTPACDDGISIDALSLSTVISDCSTFTVSPTLTSSSMTSTSLKSPMSGTLTSTRAMFVSLFGGSGDQRVDALGVDAVLLDRLGHLGGGQRAVFGQGL